MLDPTLRNCWYILKQNCVAAAFKGYAHLMYSPGEMSLNGAVLFEPPLDGTIRFYERALMLSGYHTLMTPQTGHFVYAVEALAPRVIVFDPHFIPGGAGSQHDFINSVKKMSPKSLLVGLEYDPIFRRVKGEIFNSPGSAPGYHTGELNALLPLDLIVSVTDTIPFQLPGLIETKLKN